MKLNIIIAFLSLLLLSCSQISNSEGPKNGISEILIIEGLLNPREYPLSHFVSDVEIIEIYSDSLQYSPEVNVWYSGSNNILFLDNQQIQLYLYQRSSNRLIKVGKKGKGPGEYRNSCLGTMNKEETKIFVIDKYSCDAAVYNTDGILLAQRNLGNDLPVGFLERISWDCGDYISILDHRPIKEGISYNKISQFDDNLDFIRGINPSTTYFTESEWAMTYHNLFCSEECGFFWNSESDTIYRFDAMGNSAPGYIINTKSKNKRKSKRVHGSIDLSNIYIYSINYINPYFKFTVKISRGFVDVFYNLETKDIFSIQSDSRCFEPEPNASIITIENDICGFEPVYFETYNPKTNNCTMRIPWEIDFYYNTADCLMTLEVSDSNLRDRIVGYLKEPKMDLGLVLFVMEIK